MTFKTDVTDIILDVPIPAEKVVSKKTCEIIWKNEPICSGSHIMTILTPSIVMIICTVYLKDATGYETMDMYGYHYMKFGDVTTYEIDKRGVDIDDDIRPWQVEVKKNYFKIIF